MNTKKIKARMKEKGISQKMAAIDLGTTEAQISLIVNGKGYPRMATLVKFVEYLGLSFDEALKKEVSMETGISLISKERDEQILKHGRTLDYDHGFNTQEELRIGAIALLSSNFVAFPENWDVKICHKMMSKPLKERLIIAAALIAAEIDRLNYKAR